MQTLLEVFAIVAVFAQAFLMLWKARNILLNNDYAMKFLIAGCGALVLTLLGLVLVPFLGNLGYWIASQAIFGFLLIVMIFTQLLVWTVLWDFKPSNFDSDSLS